MAIAFIGPLFYLNRQRKHYGVQTSKIFFILLRIHQRMSVHVIEDKHAHDLDSFHIFDWKNMIENQRFILNSFLF